jgi:hypothetical protein
MAGRGSLRPMIQERRGGNNTCVRRADPTGGDLLAPRAASTRRHKDVSHVPRARQACSRPPPGDPQASQHIRGQRRRGTSLLPCRRSGCLALTAACRSLPPSLSRVSGGPQAIRGCRARPTNQGPPAGSKVPGALRNRAGAPWLPHRRLRGCQVDDAASGGREPRAEARGPCRRSRA